MAQQYLDRTQICSPFKQVRGKSVSQGMRRDMTAVLKLQAVLADNLPNGLSGEGQPALVGKKMYTSRPRLLEVELYYIPCVRAERYHAFLRSLSRGDEKAGFEINVPFLQADQLRHAKTRGVEKLKDRSVAQRHLLGWLGSQQGDHFLLAQDIWYRWFEFRHFYVRHRIGWNLAIQHQKLVKASQRGQSADNAPGFLAFAPQEAYVLLKVSRLRSGARMIFHELYKIENVPAVSFDRVWRCSPLGCEVGDESIEVEVRVHSPTLATQLTVNSDQLSVNV